MGPSYLRARDLNNYKESAASCPITKASNISHFHIPQIFSFSIFPASIRDFFSLFVTFSHLRNLKECVQRRVTIPQGQQHVSPAQQSLIKPCLAGLVLGWVTGQIRIPRVVIIFFLFFFPILFQGDIKDCRAPSLV